MSIVDGGRRLTPVLSSTQGYRYVAHVQECATNTIDNINNMDNDDSRQRDETSVHA